MDENAFWALIEQSGRERSTKKARLEWLDERLGGFSVDDIIDFQKWLDICEYRSNVWDLWVAYHAVFPLGLEDGFLYFRWWLVSLGRETFERVMADPDTLIEAPEVLHLWKLARRRKSGLWSNEEYPEFQLLAAVAWQPYMKHTGLEVRSLQDEAHARTGLGGDWYEMRDDRPSPISEEEFARKFPRIMRYWGGIAG
jgi:hypothetical protein